MLDLKAPRGNSAQRVTTAERHDYARIWRRLKPAERDRRITQALARLAEGETLAQVGAAWTMTASALCRALIAYAPLEWRRALVARALIKYEQACDRLTAEPVNPTARARVWATRWHLEHALMVLGRAQVEVRGREFIGPCPQCSPARVRARSVYARIGRPARCSECGWEGDSRRYLLEQVHAAPAPAALR